MTATSAANKSEDHTLGYGSKRYRTYVPYANADLYHELR